MTTLIRCWLPGKHGRHPCAPAGTKSRSCSHCATLVCGKKLFRQVSARRRGAGHGPHSTPILLRLAMWACCRTRGLGSPVSRHLALLQRGRPRLVAGANRARCGSGGRTALRHTHRHTIVVPRRAGISIRRESTVGRIRIEALRIGEIDRCSAQRCGQSDFLPHEFVLV